MGGCRSLIARVSLCLLPALPSAQEWGGFPGVSLVAGSAPRGVVTGDFNGDGIEDLATTTLTTGADKVTVLLGNGTGGVGDGTFAAAASYSAGEETSCLTTGDFNGDGITDIAAGNDLDGNVSVLLGNGSGGVGDGTFGTAVNYTAGAGPSCVATRDFNNDGIVDLVTANSASANVSVLLGNGSGGVGDGTFASHVDYSVVASPRWVTTGDFNEDGIADLVVANEGSDQVSVLFGNGSAGVGDGTFAAHVDHATAAGPRCVATGDLDEDGIADLVTANGTSDNVSVLLGNGSAGVGDGTFAAAVDYVAGDAPSSVTIGDFDEDGIADLAVANMDSGNVSILLGKGDGTFAAHVDFAAGLWPHSVATGDFDDDGIVDLAVANNGAQTVMILLGKADGGAGDGTFAARADYASGEMTYDVTTADFNDDGIMDLATANRDANDLSVILGNGSAGVGDGTFAAPLDFGAGQRPVSVRTGDFDEDGIVDLVAANENSGNVSVLRGNAVGGVWDGTFAPAVNYFTGSYPRCVRTGDFNEDGITDLVVADGSVSNKLSVLLGNGSAGMGNGTFAAAVDYGVAGRPHGLAMGDFNGDGITDLATANTFQDTVSILLGGGSEGTGNGTFGAPVTYPAGDGPRAVVASDFNGDGIADLATANVTSDDLTVMLGNGSGGIGDGTFGVPTSYAAGDEPAGLATGDFDGDGIADIAVSNSATQNVTVFRGNGSGGVGDGTFAAVIDYGVGVEPLGVATGDFNEDGLIDIVTANFTSNNVSVLLNLGEKARFGSGSFWSLR